MRCPYYDHIGNRYCWCAPIVEIVDETITIPRRNGQVVVIGTQELRLTHQESFLGPRKRNGHRSLRGLLRFKPQNWDHPMSS